MNTDGTDKDYSSSSRSGSQEGPSARVVIAWHHRIPSPRRDLDRQRIRSTTSQARASGATVKLAWSPDGSETRLPGWRRRLRDFRRQCGWDRLENLTDNKKIQDESPSWSSDGEAITFVSNRDQGLGQNVPCRLTGAVRTQLTRDQEGGACCPAWSPAELVQPAAPPAPAPRSAGSSRANARVERRTAALAIAGNEAANGFTNVRAGLSRPSSM